MTAPRNISPAEANDRRLPVEAAPLAECPHCGGELVRVVLALVCEACGAISSPAEDAA